MDIIILETWNTKERILLLYPKNYRKKQIKAPALCWRLTFVSSDYIVYAAPGFIAFRRGYGFPFDKIGEPAVGIFPHRHDICEGPIYECMRLFFRLEPVGVDLYKAFQKFFLPIARALIMFTQACAGLYPRASIFIEK